MRLLCPLSALVLSWEQLRSSLLPKLPKTKGGSQYLQPPSNSLKCPHSPDIQNIASLSPRSGGKSPTGKPRSRKSKSGSDSDHRNLNAVVYISKSTRLGSGSAHAAPFSPNENLTSASLQVKSNSSKKPRLSSSGPFLQWAMPSSLSDEDMVSRPASQKTPQIMKQNVNEWLQRPMQPSAEGYNSTFDDMYMDVDIDVSSPLSSVKQPSVPMGIFCHRLCVAKTFFHQVASFFVIAPSPIAYGFGSRNQIRSDHRGNQSKGVCCQYGQSVR